MGSFFIPLFQTLLGDMKLAWRTVSVVPAIFGFATVVHCLQTSLYNHGMHTVIASSLLTVPIVIPGYRRQLLGKQGYDLR